MSISGAGSGQTFDEINVTPLTDVFLVLLVIMILIAPIIDKSELKIKPPETRNAKKEDESRGIMIDIDKEGRISINTKAIPKDSTSEDIQSKIQEVIKRLNKPAENVPVTVNADAESKQRDVVAIMSACAACGVKRMRVATFQHGG